MAEMVNRPHPPNPPDVGGARGGKIPAKNKEKWYKISLFCREKGGIFQVKAENFPLAPLLYEVFCLFVWVMIW